MCYSKEASQNIFFINLLTSYALFTYNSPSSIHKILALFFVFVGFMQLFDWIFWTNQDMSNEKEASINYNTTKVAMIFNHLQPIVLAGLIYTYNGHIGQMSKYILGFYCVVMLMYSINAYKNTKYTLQSEISIKSLNDLFYTNPDDDIRKPTVMWEWNTQKYSLIVYLIFLSTLGILAYENFSYPVNILFVFINVFTFLLSGYYYKGRSLGRFWCKMAAYVPLLLILLGTTKIIDI